MILFTGITLFLLIGGMGCSREAITNPEKVTNSEELIGSWKCVGFGNLKTDKTVEIKPKDCEKCYTLTFNAEKKLNGHTSTNEIWGEFIIDTSTNKIKFNELGGTKINELLDGREFVEALHQVNSYDLTKDSLLLFYEIETKYLLFNRIKK